MEKRPNQITSIILSVVLFLAALTLLAVCLVNLVTGLRYGPVRGYAELSNAATTAIISVLSLTAGISVLRNATGAPGTDEPVRLPRARWYVLIFVAIWPASLVAAYLTANTTLGDSLSIPLSAIGLGLPVLALIALAGGQLPVGPRWRAWSVLALGATVGPLLIMISEVVVFGTAAAIILLFNPDLLEQIMGLADGLSSTAALEQSLYDLAPYLLRPGILTTLYLLVSLFGPMVEELLKPLGVWLLGRDARSPAEGFALGALAGGGYALIESLGAMGGFAGTGPLLAVGRIGTSLLHILTSAIVGWAIVRLWRERRWGRMLLGYAGAVALHGLWNGLTVTTVVVALAGEINGLAGANLLAVAAAAMLVILTVAMLAGMIAVNRVLRTAPQAAQETEGAL